MRPRLRRFRFAEMGGPGTAAAATAAATEPAMAQADPRDMEDHITTGTGMAPPDMMIPVSSGSSRGIRLPVLASIPLRISLVSGEVLSSLRGSERECMRTLN